jgi:hypothetical protein
MRLSVAPDQFRPSGATRCLILGALAVAQLGWALAARAIQVPEVRYRLRVRVDDTAGVVVGWTEIHYRNTRPRPVTALTLSLRQNEFRPGALAWQGTDPRSAGATGFFRIFEARLGDTRATLQWPASPDSSRAVLPLPEPLATGDSVAMTLQWEGRPPALPWGRHRHERRLELIGWYPQILDEGAGTTVPFPALATFLVEMDLADDQVIGGTGIPLCGDPGWAEAAASARPVVTLQQDWYPAPRDPLAIGAHCQGAAAGRKHLTWYAEDVTEIAYAMSPTFRYEEGDFLELPVHALYERGEERVWGAGLATRRTETALQWMLEMGGRYPWPHVTIVEGLGGRGMALPMVVVADVSSQAAILNLQGLMLTEHVLLGGARLFTVGSSAYLAGWFFETLGRRTDYSRIEREILDWDLDRSALRDEPLAAPTSASPCATTFCRRTEFMSYQLRHWAGSDETIRNLYRALYTKFLLQPTVPGAFQVTARTLITPQPDSLYPQVLRGTLYDHAVAAARRERTGDGRWRTTAVIERRAPGLFPQTVWVVADSDTAVARAAALAPRETVSVVTRTRPRWVEVDPLVEGHDWNMLNNRRAFGLHPGWLAFAPRRPTDSYLDTYFARRSARNRLTLGWAPTAWYNDAGGWTFGGRLRQDYMGRFELNEAWASVSTGAGTAGGRTDFHGVVLLRNPVWLRARGWSQELTLARAEGRTAAGVEVARRFRGGLSDSTVRSLAIGLNWLSVTEPAYLSPRFYDDAGTAEAGLTGVLRVRGDWQLAIKAVVAAGHAYPNRGATIAGGSYGRFHLTGSVRHGVGKRVTLGARLFAGTTVSADSAPRQRRLFLSGADPYERFGSPFLRSRGSLLAGSGLPYHAPGGAGVRGLNPEVGASRALGASVEVEYALHRRTGRGLFNRLAVAGFADGALANGDLDPGRNRLISVADAGIGIRLDHRLGQTSFQTRFDFPLWVSRPALAHDDRPAGPFGLRWSFSFLPAF